jgi:hypothetical protein
MLTSGLVPASSDPLWAPPLPVDATVLPLIELSPLPAAPAPDSLEPEEDPEPLPLLVAPPPALPLASGLPLAPRLLPFCDVVLVPHATPNTTRQKVNGIFIALSPAAAQEARGPTVVCGPTPSRSYAARDTRILISLLASFKNR